MIDNHGFPPPLRRSRVNSRLPGGLRAWARPLALLALLVLLILVIEGPSPLRLQWLVRPLPWGERGAHGPGSLSGLPRVIDGDTIVLDGRHIRLNGIDAPESDQICQDRNGAPWACGQAATTALKLHLGWGVMPVRCEGTGIDRYRRVLATCFRGDQNLNQWMVRQGWAVAYREYETDYVADEAQARAAGAGLWSGTFMMPWDWRRAQSEPTRHRSG